MSFYKRKQRELLPRKRQEQDGGWTARVRWFRRFLSTLMMESLDPIRASLAVGLGVLLGIIPIYGFQSIAAITLSSLLGLNKPLTFGATFINNPVFQPFLILFSLEMGHLLLYGRFHPLSLRGFSDFDPWKEVSTWLVGSFVLGIILSVVTAILTYSILNLVKRHREKSQKQVRSVERAVNSLFSESASFDRNFVKWKLRLDKVFQNLARDDMGDGPVVDLGCGYGIGLAVAAILNPKRRLRGCDLDKKRVQIASRALNRFDTELSVCDIQEFDLEDPGLVIIIDVLQYLDGNEQLALLEKCCSSALPGAILIFRIPDCRRGLFSILSILLDKLVFRLSGTKKAPSILSPEQYCRVLEKAGMEVEYQRMVNTLPLAHVLFRAVKPRNESSLPRK